MAGFTLLALLDDISTVLDDVAVLTKATVRKTAGVLGDDLALTAQQVFGVRAQRELPVVISVARGSLLNKLFLIPGALALSFLAPWLINPLLMLGGAYLCAEGGGKVFNLLSGRRPHPSQALPEEAVEKLLAGPVSEPPADHRALEIMEKKKISGAVRTDFVLSTEIIVIALGSIPLDISLALRAAILVSVGLLITFGVYGLVALIVKLDDIGFWLAKKRGPGRFGFGLGKFLILASPKLMKLLTLTGTAAMFMVGGGILAHGLSVSRALEESLPVWPWIINILAGFAAGLFLFPLTLGLEKAAEKIKKIKTSGR
ncbi:MAG: DUF808 domain-containing protein [Deltaproteobacteria bacterium]|jgi:predicted DNA repair protein MutK|nr:DUF808 domain-containing protein [Deltaproteobacteria bacterium]